MGNRVAFVNVSGRFDKGYSGGEVGEAGEVVRVYGGREALEGAVVEDVAHVCMVGVQVQVGEDVGDMERCGMCTVDDDDVLNSASSGRLHGCCAD